MNSMIDMFKNNTFDDFLETIREKEYGNGGRDVGLLRGAVDFSFGAEGIRPAHF